MYDAEQNEPAWVQSIATQSALPPGTSELMNLGSPYLRENGSGSKTGGVAGSSAEQATPVGCPPVLMWYVEYGFNDGN